MAVNYAVNVSVSGGNRRGAFGGGSLAKTKTTLNTNRTIEPNEQGEINLSKVFTVGLAFNKAQQGNEILGAYSGDRQRQRKIDMGLTFAKYGIGIAINPLAGGIYAVGDIGYRSIMYSIKVDNQRKQAQALSNLSGNNSFSGRRYRGSYS